MSRLARRRIRMLCGLFATAGCLAQVGCPFTGRVFREAALPAIQTGVTGVVNGILDGVFAVIQPDATPDDTNNSNP